MVSLPLFIVLAISAAPDAGTAATAQEQAQVAMEQGVAARERGELETALGYFKQAEELVPTANLPYRFAGEVEEQLQRYQAAVASYETYLKVKPWVRDADDVRRRIADLKARYLEGQLKVECPVSGVSVQVDDSATPLGVTPFAEPRTLSAGTHTLTFKAPTGETSSTELTVVPGLQPVDCNISPKANANAKTDAPTQQPLLFSPREPEKPATTAATATGELPSEPPLYRRPWVWGAAAAVLIGGGVAAYALTRPGVPDSDGGLHRFPAP